jgi:hypothetical protein
VSDDYGRGTVTTGVLAPGANVVGNIETYRDEDWFRIDLDANTTYQIALTAATTGGWPNMWDAPRVGVWDPAGFNGNGDWLVLNDQGRYGYDPLVWVKTTHAGTYYVAVTGSQGLGAYQLSATLLSKDDFSDQVQDAAAVAPGQVQAGRIEIPGDADMFRVDLKAGVSYEFHADGDNGRGSAALPTVVILAKDQSGNVSQVSSYFREGYPVNYTPASDKLTYYAAVRDVDSRLGKGDYTFSYRAAADDFAANAQTSGAIAVGQTVKGVAELPTDRDWLKFSATAGQSYTFTLSPGTENLTPHSLYLGLLDSNGNRLNASVLEESGNGRKMLTWTPSQPGEYFVEVANLSGSAAYELAMALSPRDDYSAGPDTRATLSPGSSMSGKLELLRDEDWIKVHVDANATYTFKLDNPNIHGFSLVDAAGTPVKLQYSGGNTLVLSAGSTADYYLKVGDGWLANLAYAVSASVTRADYIANSASTSATLAPGQLMRSAIDYVSDHDWIKVQLTAGKQYTFAVSAKVNGEGTLSSPNLSLLDAGGRQVGYASYPYGQDPYISTYVDKSGTYFIDVSSSGTGATGSYVLKMGGEGIPLPDTIAPSAQKADGPNYAGKPDEPFRVLFSENIQLGTGSVVLREAATGKLVESFNVAGNPQVSVYYSSLKIDPAAPLLPGTDYKLEIAAGAVKDLAGNPLASAAILTLRTADAPRNLPGTSGNDVFASGTGSDSFAGGDGIDTVVFKGNESGYSRSWEGATLVVSQNTGSYARDQLTSIERLVFDDVSLALDARGVAGQAYRLYQAALGRTPDYKGLGFWINAMDKGMALKDVAANFVASTEFQNRFAGNGSDEAFLATVYRNVLHREPDQAGLDYWAHALHDGADKADILMHFSESNENQLALSHIQGGIWFTPFG